MEKSVKQLQFSLPRANWQIPNNVRVGWTLSWKDTILWFLYCCQFSHLSTRWWVAGFVKEVALSFPRLGITLVCEVVLEQSKVEGQIIFSMLVCYNGAVLGISNTIVVFLCFFPETTGFWLCLQRAILNLGGVYCKWNPAERKDEFYA